MYSVRQRCTFIVLNLIIIFRVSPWVCKIQRAIQLNLTERGEGEYEKTSNREIFRPLYACWEMGSMTDATEHKVILFVEIHMTWNFLAHGWKKALDTWTLFAMPYLTQPLLNQHCGASDLPFAFCDHTSHKKALPLPVRHKSNIASWLVFIWLWPLHARVTEETRTRWLIARLMTCLRWLMQQEEVSILLSGNRVLTYNHANERVAFSTIPY